MLPERQIIKSIIYDKYAIILHCFFYKTTKDTKNERLRVLRALRGKKSDSPGIDELTVRMNHRGVPPLILMVRNVKTDRETTAPRQLLSCF